MIFKHLTYLIDICLCPGIFGFHRLNFIRGLFKNTEKSFFFLLIIKALKLFHYIGKQLAYFPQILCLHIFKSAF